MPKSAQKIMGSGVAPLVALTMNGSVADTLSATGSTQGTAFLMSGDSNVFTTVAASTGAILPPQSVTTPGDEVIAVNLGANTLTIYPQVGGTIQAGAANAGFAVAAGKSAKFIARTGGLNWAAFLSA